MAVNKVVMNTEDGEVVLMDLTSDSVTPETLAAGYTAHDASGNAIKGTMALTLGVHTDGLLYIFVNGVPTGNGVAFPTEYGDVYGNIDSESNIILRGVVPGGTYTVKYEMEDGSTVEIGELVLDTNTYYSVTNNLTNCTNGNSATTAIEGNSYSATISANSGYELSSIVVTMGGMDITSSVVSGGTISIASVTGNIVITAVAEEKVAELVNQIPISTDENGNLLVGENGEKGYLPNSRISSSDTTGAVQTVEGIELTGFIPFKNGDVLIGNAYIFSPIGNDGSTSFKNTTAYNNITCFDANRQRVGCVKWDLRTTTVVGLTVNEDSSFVFDSNANGTVPSTTAYIRASLNNITDSSILTVTQDGGEDTPSYHNILDDTTIQLNTRLSATPDATKEQDGVFATDWIDCAFSSYPDPFYLYMRGCTWDTESPAYTYLWYTDEDGANGDYTSYTEVIETLENGDLRLKVGYQAVAGKYAKYDLMKKIRISARVSNSAITDSDMANVIITINEPIPD